MHTSDYWIEQLKMEPHPEGGFYKETYRSDFYASAESLKQSHNAERRCSSLIYYLLTSNDFSQFHRLKSDEIWLYHKGGPLKIYVLDNKTGLKVLKLGSNPEQHEMLQIVIPANKWFAAEVDRESDFSLVSCMVSPGFVYEDFELADRIKLSNLFPGYKKLIEKLTR